MGSLRSYIAGFILSLICTLGAYGIVSQHVGSHHAVFAHAPLISLIIALALFQLIAQLVFFLHLTKESKPRWNIMALGFAVMVVVIVVFGSLWIMQNLSYHHPDAHNIDNAIIHDEGIQ